MAEVLEEYVGRLAPSPTGALHLGNVRTFMIAWLRARSLGGRILLRMEDLDHPRDKPGAADGAIEDLRWLGFDWDGSCVLSERRSHYRAALERLGGLVYPCVCSRRDVEAAQSAPHDGDQLRYPGTCRGRFASWDEALACKSAANAGQGSLAAQTPCWRFRVEPGTVVEFDDVFAGRFSQDVFASLGDFPLARDRDGAGYTLACTVDDVLSGVTEVVRGDDLLAATPAQILVARALGAKPPRYCHVPLVVGRDGRRLAKRHGDTRISALRAAGAKPEEILGALAFSCGWAERGECISLAGLVPRFDLSSIPRTPYAIDLGATPDPHFAPQIARAPSVSR